MVEDVKGFGPVVVGLQLLLKQSKYVIIKDIWHSVKYKVKGVKTDHNYKIIYCNL
jgi:hypothetical protein